MNGTVTIVIATVIWTTIGAVAADDHCEYCCYYLVVRAGYSIGVVMPFIISLF